MVKKSKSQKGTAKTEEEKPSDSSSATKTVKESSKKTSKKKSQTMDELLSATGYSIKGFKKGDIIEGKITKVSPREVLVDIGGKSEGVVIDRELETYKEMLMALEIGSIVTAQIIVEENDRGQSVLSLRRNIIIKRWVLLEEQFKSGEAVEVVIKDTVRGGVLVDYGGLRGYIPQSQLESNISRQLDKLSGRKVRVKIIEVDKESNRLVFSQRAIAEAEAFAKQKDIIDELQEGKTVEVVITGVVPFGAFAKLTIEKDGKTHEVEGLIHISEIAWEKVEDPGQYLNPGDTIKVKVLKLDKKTGKVTLSLKQLMPDPWEHVQDMFEKDSQVKGKVTRVTPYGIFVKLSPGIEGLIHISKINPGEEPKKDEEMTCIIEEVQAEKRKISLSPALTEKPIGYR
ncbi:30S ribosomal protein S1 [Patescibacteria group bacterium]